MGRSSVRPPAMIVPMQATACALAADIPRGGAEGAACPLRAWHAVSRRPGWATGSQSKRQASSEANPLTPLHCALQPLHDNLACLTMVSLVITFKHLNGCIA